MISQMISYEYNKVPSEKSNKILIFNFMLKNIPQQSNLGMPAHSW